MHAADRLVLAIRAGYIGGLAGAGYWSEGAVEHADDLPQIDVGRVARQQVSPALALPALQDPLVLEPKQDQLEKFRRDLLFPGEIGDPHRLVTTAVGEREQRFDGVLGLLGEHERRI